jgi:hypothetical protein
MDRQLAITEAMRLTSIPNKERTSKRANWVAIVNNNFESNRTQLSQIEPSTRPKGIFSDDVKMSQRPSNMDILLKGNDVELELTPESLQVTA